MKRVLQWVDIFSLACWGRYHLGESPLNYFLPPLFTWGGPDISPGGLLSGPHFSPGVPCEVRLCTSAGCLTLSKNQRTFALIHLSIVSGSWTKCRWVNSPKVCTFHSYENSTICVPPKSPCLPWETWNSSNKGKVNELSWKSVFLMIILPPVLQIIVSFLPATSTPVNSSAEESLRVFLHSVVNVLFVPPRCTFPPSPDP